MIISKRRRKVVKLTRRRAQLNKNSSATPGIPRNKQQDVTVIRNKKTKSMADNRLVLTLKVVEP